MNFKSRSQHLRIQKMKNLHRLLCLMLLLVTNSVRSQNWTIGATGSIGFSKVTSNLPISGDYRVKFALSGNWGAFIEKKIGRGSALGIEILWVQVEGKEVTLNKELKEFNGQELEVVGVVSDQTRLHASYVGLPVFYQLGIGKLGIRAGIQPMIFLFANSTYKISGTLYGEPYKDASKTKDIALERFEIGLKAGIDYRINDAFRLRIDYYHGLTDITPDEFPWDRRNRQISLGTQYIFGAVAR